MNPNKWTVGCEIKLNAECTKATMHLMISKDCNKKAYERGLRWIFENIKPSIEDLLETDSGPMDIKVARAQRRNPNEENW